ncbi:MAG: SurA N-terminal domain-containing protein [Spirochaetia bacterium]|nr:SurA N-terminal domain-containing protein [Spirochaetia bacterium]MDY2825488.1 SurA N-terminal domain-containing protein [Treponema sp.]MCI6365710.1 SurA N-terminal domain-containing protein [Spirochaetia bacterium]MCI6545305.1 SurA N-terminal domain-containing protein [Spirochaetia bacterium]MCI7435275.1 SurA N-terminal domain-containing protein [Spirochaetia bacterium]
MKRFAIALFALFMSAAVFAQSDLQVLAVVKLNKNESITVKKLKTRVEMYEKQRGTALSVDDRKKVLDALIQEKLVLQAAQKAGVTLTDSAVEQMFLQQVSSQLLGRTVTQSELEEVVKQETNLSLDDFMKQQIGMSVEEYKTYLKNQTIVQQYIMRQRENELKAVAATDEEIRSFYELNKSSFVWTDMMKLFLVVVPKSNDGEAARVKADDLYKKLKEKKLSSNQITVESKKENSGFQSGEILINKNQTSAQQLGISYTDLISLFSNEKDYISNVSEFDTHFQFYMIIKKYDAKLLGLSDVVQPDSTTTVYDYIRSSLGQQKVMQYFTIAAQEIAEGLDKEENVERKKTGDALTKLLTW